MLGAGSQMGGHADKVSVHKQESDHTSRLEPPPPPPQFTLTPQTSPRPRHI